MAVSMLARIKPYNPKRGHVLRRYVVWGIRFEERRGWYRVKERVAKYLKEVRTKSNDPDSPLAFDVMTQAEAENLEGQEKKAAIERAEAKSPNVAGATDLTTADIHAPASGSSSDKPSGDDEGKDDWDKLDSESGGGPQGGGA